MPNLTLQLTLALLLFVLTVAVRAATVNRLVKGKLRLTLVLSAAAAVIAATATLLQVPAEYTERVRSVETLLLALAAITFFVVTAINPLRADRVPTRYPNIVQDAIIVILFAIAATAVLQEKFWTTSAVGAVVVGFALQDTLGNAFAGLAIQIEKPFRVGQWVQVAGHEGLVEEVTWRATKLRTKANTYLVVPNNEISKSAIVNFSEPSVPTRVAVDVGASYLVPPNEVKAAMLDAVASAPLALSDPVPDVLLVDFGASAITYRARFWVHDYGVDDEAKDQVRSGIYYIFRRRGIEIPYPIQIEYSKEEPPARTPVVDGRLAATLAQVPLFASLADDERHDLALACEPRLYGAGEAVVRQNDVGRSMFVVEQGTLRVTVEPGDVEVAVVRSGGYFGEMSLLTGAPRTATVRAVGDDCHLLELTAESFRQFVSEKPEVLAAITSAVEKRRVELEKSRAAASQFTAAPGEGAGWLLSRVKKFLRLPD